MRRKFYITDDDGSQYEVEEIHELSDDDDISLNQNDEDELTSDEISALKRLASISDKLIALLQTSSNDSEDEDLELTDEDEDEDEEQVIDTDEEPRRLTKDSKYQTKKSVAALERRTVKTDDSLLDEVADAWAKRYGGTK